MCGGCKEEFGPLDAALERKVGRVKALREQIDETRRLRDEALRKRDEVRDRIFGLDGSAADYFANMMNLAGEAEGKPLYEIAQKAKELHDLAKTGKAISEQDFSEFADYVKAKLQSKLKDLQQKALFRLNIEQAKRIAREQGPSEATESFLKNNERIRKSFKVLGIIDASISYAQACKKMVEDIREWMELNEELKGHEKNLSDLHEDLDRTVSEISCIRAEMENEGTPPPEPEPESEPGPQEDEQEKGEEGEAPGQPDAGDLGGAAEDFEGAGESAEQASEDATDAVSALSPFIFGGWEDLPEPVLLELIARAMPPLSGASGGMDDAFGSGRNGWKHLDDAGGGGDGPVMVHGSFFRSRLRAQVAETLPAPEEVLIVPKGAGIDAAAARISRGVGSVALPAGEYTVYVDQGHSGGSRPYMEVLRIGEEGIADLRVDSGLRLRTAEWAPVRDFNYGWWGVVPSGDHHAAGIKSRHDTPLILAPGRYDVLWAKGYESRDRPMMLARGVDVEAGAVAEVRAESGVRLELPEGARQLDSNYGWWGASPAGAGPEAWVNAWHGSAGEHLLLPPGTYDL
jgi:hypothetical protein